MTNFFEHQHAAQRRTFWLVVFFILGIVALVSVTYLLVAVLFVAQETRPGQTPTWWHLELFVGVTAIVLMVVAGCSVYKIAELSSGGKAVALLLGGREMTGQTSDPQERRLLNVVEEMAIASGMPVLPVYVLEEEKGINAFAAGYAPGDAVVAVSRGCLEHLTRDELQGVVAHEFSHILNGDMRLNIRLMGMIFGLIGLAIIGRVLMRSSYGSSSRRSSKGGGGQIVLLGLGLYLLGMVGAFFGNLIKAAVSRQREFLADASAVQFTRNPDGIAGALKKIGGLHKGSNIDSPHAAEASHMFFADALVSARLTSLLATHPPLEERIRRIDSRWDGTYPKVRRVAVSAAEEGPQSRQGPLPTAGMPTLPGMPHIPLPVLVAGAEEAVGRVGTVTPAQTDYAAKLHAAIPEELQQAAHEPFSARALVYALLLAPAPATRASQLARLQAEAEPRDYDETLRLAEPVAALPAEVRLPLIDLAVPALRRMSPGQYDHFRQQIEHLTAADQCVSVFEYVLRCVLERYLDEAFGRRAPAPPARRETWVLTPHVVTVLSLLAWEGHEREEQARAAFDVGMRRYLRGANPHALLPRPACSLGDFDQRLRLLAAAPAGAKRRILLACADCITADHQVTVSEMELYRAIGAVLGYPMPPLAIKS